MSTEKRISDENTRPGGYEGKEEEKMTMLEMLHEQAAIEARNNERWKTAEYTILADSKEVGMVHITGKWQSDEQMLLDLLEDGFTVIRYTKN